VWPVGASAPLDVDVRIVSATHADLEARIEQGTFRADLYWRLAVIPVRVPPLRERRGDVAPLVQRFLAEAAARRGARPLAIAQGVLDRLCGYRWPGNIRELANLCERLATLKDGGMVEEADLPAGMRRACRAAPAGAVDLRAEVTDLEWKRIDEALAASGGNRARAARMIGMKRTTLVERLKRRRQDEGRVVGDSG
jgi:DNA-binding NtrC family response regulator